MEMAEEFARKNGNIVIQNSINNSKEYERGRFTGEDLDFQEKVRQKLGKILGDDSPLSI